MQLAHHLDINTLEHTSQQTKDTCEVECSKVEGGGAEYSNEKVNHRTYSLNTYSSVDR